jgi:ribonuclease-3 family protein
LSSSEAFVESASSSITSSSERGGGGGSMQRDTWRVPIPPHLHGKAPRRHWNANALAFLGDSVWELYARRRFFYPPSRKDSYFAQVTRHVRAETQARRQG